MGTAPRVLAGVVSLLGAVVVCPVGHVRVVVLGLVHLVEGGLAEGEAVEEEEELVVQEVVEELVAVGEGEDAVVVVVVDVEMVLDVDDDDDVQYTCFRLASFCFNDIPYFYALGGVI